MKVKKLKKIIKNKNIENYYNIYIYKYYFF